MLLETDPHKEELAYLHLVQMSQVTGTNRSSGAWEIFFPSSIHCRHQNFVEKRSPMRFLIWRKFFFLWHQDLKKQVTCVSVNMIWILKRLKLCDSSGTEPVIPSPGLFHKVLTYIKSSETKCKYHDGRIQIVWLKCCTCAIFGYH